MNPTHNSTPSIHIRQAAHLALRVGLAAALCGMAQIASASTPSVAAIDSASATIRQLNAEGSKSRGPCPPYRFVSAPADDGMATERAGEGDNRRRRCYMYVAADFADTSVVRLERI
jgi:hypothetical protein